MTKQNNKEWLEQEVDNINKKDDDFTFKYVINSDDLWIGYIPKDDDWRDLESYVGFVYDFNKNNIEFDPSICDFIIDISLFKKLINIAETYKKRLESDD